MRAMPTIRTEALLGVFVLIVYRVLLDLAYVFIVSRVFRYMDFVLDLNGLKLTESYVLLLVVLIVMPKSHRNFSGVLIWLVVMLSFIPLLTIYGLENESRVFTYAVTLFWLFLFLLVRHFPEMKVGSFKKDHKLILALFLLLNGYALLMIQHYFGIRFFFNLARVYETRGAYSAAGIPFAGYLFNWLGYIINPFFFILFLTRKKFFDTFIVLMIQLILFSATGYKTFLFAPVFVFALAAVFKSKRPLVNITVFINAVILAGMASYYLLGDIWISSLFIRRSLLDQGKISYYYYDYFSKNDFTYLSHSVLRSFLDYPYTLSPARLIGEEYSRYAGAYMNTGIVGDGFMNFGFSGLFLWCILFFILLKVIDSFSRGKNIFLLAALFGMPAIVMTNSGLLTTLSTHGLFVAVVVLCLLPRVRTGNTC